MSEERRRPEHFHVEKPSETGVYEVLVEEKWRRGDEGAQIPKVAVWNGRSWQGMKGEPFESATTRVVGWVRKLERPRGEGP
jgi:hypothetical protein